MSPMRTKPSSKSSHISPQRRERSPPAGRRLSSGGSSQFRRDRVPSSENFENDSRRDSYGNKDHSASRRDSIDHDKYHGRKGRSPPRDGHSPLRKGQSPLRRTDSPFEGRQSLNRRQQSPTRRRQSPMRGRSPMRGLSLVLFRLLVPVRPRYDT